MTSAALEAPPTPSLTPGAPDSPALRPSGLGRLQGWLQRPLVACLLLLAIYGALTVVLNDPRGTLGTDTGGKLATLHMMERNGGLDPDVGYWAAASDPKGVLHPLFYTFQVDGKWVNATTLPMLYAAYPLYLAGGDRAVLLLPMFGAMLSALAARALARRLGARTGWTAFWTIGLATPVAIYALDFWEHSLGLALMLWGFVFLYDVAEERAGWRAALAGGMLFGAAATMRTEALVYFAVTGLVTSVVVLSRRRTIAPTVGRGLAMVAGVAVPVLLNQLLEYATVGGSMRAGRASSTAGAVGSSLSTRVQEAFMTTIGLNRFELNLDLVLGALIVALVVYGTWRLSRRDESARLVGGVVMTVAAILIVLRFADGLGFVSGMLTASPLAAVGLALGWGRKVRLPVIVACAALPLVWAFQYSGGAGPQWGGRYTLVSGALLAVVAVVVLEGRRVALLGVLAVSVLVTGYGLAWLSQRSNTVAEGFEAIVARHDHAIISVEAHALREGGAFYDSSRPWLTATTQGELTQATRILLERHIDEFALVASEGRHTAARIGPFTKRGTQRVVFLRPDIHLEVVTYRSS